MLITLLGILFFTFIAFIAILNIIQNETDRKNGKQVLSKHEIGGADPVKVIRRLIQDIKETKEKKLKEKLTPDQLVEKAKNKNKDAPKVVQLGKFACPGCGYLTFQEIPGGSHATCNICFWEDKPI